MADSIKFAAEIKGFMKDMPLLGEKDNAENWTEVDDPSLDVPMYDKFSGELFGVLVQLTEGEAKATLKEMVDKGVLQDGYKALLILGKRFDNQTIASLLQMFLEVIAPGGLKPREIVAGIYKWEAKVAVLSQKFGESVGGNIKLAI